MLTYELICCVVNSGAASKVLRIAHKNEIKGGTITLGRGTVSSRLLDILGISDTRKEIVMMIAEKGLAAAALKGISEEMEFHKPHHGIAFSIPVSEVIGPQHENKPNAVSSEVRESVYNIIYVIVAKGKAEDVIEAANKAGSRGGTIVNARGSGVHESQKLFSMEIEPEQEKVFIIAKKELRDGIVKSIRDHLMIDEPGNGLLFVMDIEEIYGLH